MAFLNPTAIFILKIVLGLLFLISGILKIPNLKKFHNIVLQFRILKGTLAKLFSYTLPFIETITGIFLLLGLYLKIFSALTVLLLLSSTIAVSYALYKKNKLKDCGCYGGVIKSPINKTKLIENIIWLLFSNLPFHRLYHYSLKSLQQKKPYDFPLLTRH